MNADERLIDEFLATDPRDVGCDTTMDVLDVYAEAVRAGEDPEQRFPGVTSHLRSCPPCAEDLRGLLALLGAEDERPGPLGRLFRRRGR